MGPDLQSINILKGLIMDGVRNADSGHTGGAMSSSDFAYLLFQDYLSYDPDDPQWFNRDRFILSAGHESMLLYSLLAMIGYLTIDDLKDFRSLNSRTPGHPEVETPGVEATTGPLGQGVGMGIGMAIAETILAHILGDDVIDHYTYILAGDGDLQEPVCLGAAELAGHYRLGKVIMYYDRNQVQISGSTSRSDNTDFGQVFNAMGWHVQTIDGHDHEAIHKSIRSAQAKQDQPSLIIGNTTMAAGAASMEGQAATHGAPLPPEEIAATKLKLNLPDTQFYLPEAALAQFRGRQPELRNAARDWGRLIEKRGQDGKWAQSWQQTCSDGR